MEKLINTGVEDYIINYMNNVSDSNQCLLNICMSQYVILSQGGNNALVVACGISSEKVSLKLVNMLLAAGVHVNQANKVIIYIIYCICI